LAQLETYLGIIIAFLLATVLFVGFTLAGKKRKGAVGKETAIQEALIEGEEEKAEVKAPEAPIDLTIVRGIGPKWSEKLKAAGINSTKDLAECNSEDLAKKIMVSEKMASRWIKNANEFLSGQ